MSIAENPQVVLIQDQQKNSQELKNQHEREQHSLPDLSNNQRITPMLKTSSVKINSVNHPSNKIRLTQMSREFKETRRVSDLIMVRFPDLREDLYASIVLDGETIWNWWITSSCLSLRLKDSRQPYGAQLIDRFDENQRNEVIDLSRVEELSLVLDTSKELDVEVTWSYYNTIEKLDFWKYYKYV